MDLIYEYKDTKAERILEWAVDHPFLALFSFIALIFALIFLLMCIRLNTGEKVYTGYIYSAEDTIFMTVGHLRFSENAGMDEQPSFCVDKKDGQQIKELSGSGKKVRVVIPAGFAISAPWACGIPANIEIMGDE